MPNLKFSFFFPPLLHPWCTYHILKIEALFSNFFFFSKITLTSVLIREGSSLLRILLDFPFHLPLSLQRKPMMVQSSLSQKTICIFASNIMFVCLAEYFTILIFLSNFPLSLQSSTTTQVFGSISFSISNVLSMTRIKIVMTMMTGLKDFSALEFIVWPPSSP